jgi:hypothetical protein
MSQRFSYAKYDTIRAEKQQRAKALVEAVEAFIDGELAHGRQVSLAMKALEECYMWVGKAIRDEQIAHDGGRFTEETTRGEEGVNVAPKDVE